MPSKQKILWGLTCSVLLFLSFYACKKREADTKSPENAAVTASWGADVPTPRNPSVPREFNYQEHWRFHEEINRMVKEGQRSKISSFLSEKEKSSLTLRPSIISRMPELAAYIASSEFKGTEYGKSFLTKVAAAEQRRVDFQRALVGLPSKDKLEKMFIHEDCPGECCTINKLTALNDTPLFDSAG